MLPQDLVQKIVDRAKNRKHEGDGGIDFAKEAKHAAAKKLMGAIKSDDSELFLQALSELNTINEDDSE